MVVVVSRSWETRLATISVRMAGILLDVRDIRPNDTRRGAHLAPPGESSSERVPSDRARRL